MEFYVLVISFPIVLGGVFASLYALVQFATEKRVFPPALESRDSHKKRTSVSLTLAKKENHQTLIKLISALP